MTSTSASGLTVPIRAEHIDAALVTAREDQEAFRQAELAWLDERFPFLKARVEFAFSGHIGEFGIVKAEAVMAGMLLGSHAVRKCLDDEIEPAKLNFMRHFGSTTVTSEKQFEVYNRNWDTAEILGQIFDDPKLVASLMEIKHPSARNAAAVQLVCLCFAEMPFATEQQTN